MSGVGDGVCDEFGVEFGVRCAAVQYPGNAYCAAAESQYDEEVEIVASATSWYFVSALSYVSSYRTDTNSLFLIPASLPSLSSALIL